VPDIEIRHGMRYTGGTSFACQLAFQWGPVCLPKLLVTRNVVSLRSQFDLFQPSPFEVKRGHHGELAVTRGDWLGALRIDLIAAPSKRRCVLNGVTGDVGGRVCFNTDTGLCLMVCERISSSASGPVVDAVAPPLKLWPMSFQRALCRHGANAAD